TSSPSPNYANSPTPVPAATPNSFWYWDYRGCAGEKWQAFASATASTSPVPGYASSEPSSPAEKAADSSSTHLRTTEHAPYRWSTTSSPSSTVGPETKPGTSGCSTPPQGRRWTNRTGSGPSPGT